MPLVLAAPLPGFAAPCAEGRLAALCARWEHSLAPHLSAPQRAHCRRFGEGGGALWARASRLLARLLALRALPGGSVLDMDDKGRPRLAGAPGWHIAFSHSGRAAFCLVLTPAELAGHPPGEPALDAEAAGALPATARAFAAPAPTPRADFRRWLLAEALFKALGAAPEHWKNAAHAAQRGANRPAGGCIIRGKQLSWRFVPAPGHELCVALPGGAPFAVGLRWRAWQSFL